MYLNKEGCRQLIVMMVIQAFRDMRKDIQARRLWAKMGNRIWLIDEYGAYCVRCDRKSNEARPFAIWHKGKMKSLRSDIMMASDAERWLKSVHCAELRYLAKIDGFGDGNMHAAIERVKNGPKINWT